MRLFPGRRKKCKIRKDTGRHGEDLAADFLDRKGYTILRRNFRLRSGEIDIIAQDGNLLVFIEVKTRSCSRFGSPFDAVDVHKQHQITRTALAFMSSEMPRDTAVRFDVIGVYLDGNTPRIEHLKNAFEYNPI